MKREVLSLVIAAGFIAAVFIFNETLRRDDGVAYASSGTVMAREIRDGAGIPSDRLREIRQNVSMDSSKLLDVTGREIYAVFSHPELIRTDSPTTIWQYRNSFCVLDVYFTTRDKTALRAPAVHYEVRARGKGVADEAVQGRCVRDLVRANSGMNLLNVNALYKKSI